MVKNVILRTHVIYLIETYERRDGGEKIVLARTFSSTRSLSGNPHFWQINPFYEINSFNPGLSGQSFKVLDPSNAITSKSRFHFIFHIPECNKIMIKLPAERKEGGEEEGKKSQTPVHKFPECARNFKNIDNKDSHLTGAFILPV